MYEVELMFYYILDMDALQIKRHLNVCLNLTGKEKNIYFGYKMFHLFKKCVRKLQLVILFCFSC